LFGSDQLIVIFSEFKSVFGADGVSGLKAKGILKNSEA
jgi:hypothetical protein